MGFTATNWRARTGHVVHCLNKDVQQFWDQNLELLKAPFQLTPSQKQVRNLVDISLVQNKDYLTDQIPRKIAEVDEYLNELS